MEYYPFEINLGKPRQPTLIKLIAGKITYFVNMFSFEAYDVLLDVPPCSKVSSCFSHPCAGADELRWVPPSHLGE